MPYRWLVIPVVASVVAAPRLHARQEPTAPCARLEAAVRANPDDPEAAVNLGRCALRDEEMVVPGGDSSRLAFRTSWNPALRALRRVAQREPGNSRALAIVFRMLFAETRDGCSRAAGLCLHVASVVRDGDSLITTPRLVPRTSMNPYDEFMNETSRHQTPSLDEALAIADRWVAVAPNDHRPHQYRGQSLLRLGDFARASDALERAAVSGTPESRRRLFWDRFEAFVKANRGADARRVLDEAAADPGRDTTQLRDYTVASLNALIGRHRPPPVDSVRLRRVIERVDSAASSRPRVPRREPGFEELLAAGDTAGARRVLAQLESVLTSPPGTTRIPRYHEADLHIARFHLALGDTTRAEAKLADIERPFNTRPFQYSIMLAYATHSWLGHVWLLSGDVAAARGRSADAERMYSRIVGLWGGGDAPFQPVVTEARSKLAALSRRR